MCIGVPMRVLVSDGAMALCEGRGGVQQQLNMLMVGSLPPGSWVLSSLGSARQVLSEADAKLINGALDELEAALPAECLTLPT